LVQSECTHAFDGATQSGVPALDNKSNFISVKAMLSTARQHMTLGTVFCAAESLN